jgi:hypothetical protein
MTVAEFVEELHQLPQDLEVYVALLDTSAPEAYPVYATTTEPKCVRKRGSFYKVVPGRANAVVINADL